MRRVWRLVLAAVLFAGWLGYLFYLTRTASNPVVLSRPQFLVADLDVIAQIDDPQSKQAIVEEVCWARKGVKAPEKKDVITISNLDRCEKPGYAWKSPGKYIVPLRESRQGVYEVAQVPPSPGFPAAGGEGTARIYPDTTQTRQQLERLKPE